LSGSSEARRVSADKRLDPHAGFLIIIHGEGGTMSISIIKPPFTKVSAVAKVKAAEEAWNTRDPERVALAYTPDCEWRNRDQFFKGREAIKAFLHRKWERELDYRLMKELWAFTDDRISVRFEYEWHDEAGNWFRSHGNEHWEFDRDGLMRRRDASINDIAIRESERRYF
jgi:nuclear transport factor 2 (NTF2) superfamily protein